MRCDLPAVIFPLCVLSEKECLEPCPESCLERSERAMEREGKCNVHTPHETSVFSAVKSSCSGLNFEGFEYSPRPDGILDAASALPVEYGVQYVNFCASIPGRGQGLAPMARRKDQ
jgi:hypothetical protein